MARIFQLGPARAGAGDIFLIAPVKHENATFKSVNRGALGAIHQKQHIGPIGRLILIGQPNRLRVCHIGKTRIALCRMGQKGFVFKRP